MNDLTSNRLNELEIEIKDLKKKTALGILEIGDRLNEAKQLVPFGEWENWLAYNVEISQRTARNFMKISQVYKVEKRQALADLEVTKLYSLVRIPEEEQEYFLKAMDEIGPVTTREFEYYIRLWTDEEFNRQELHRIVNNILENCTLEELKKAEEILSHLAREASITVVEAQCKIGELLSAEQ